MAQLLIIQFCMLMTLILDLGELQDKIIFRLTGKKTIIGLKDFIHSKIFGW